MKKVGVAAEKAEVVLLKAQPVLAPARLHVEAAAAAAFTTSYPASVGLLLWLAAVVFILCGYMVLPLLKVALRLALYLLKIVFKITLAALRLAFSTVRLLTAPLRCLARCACTSRRRRPRSQPT